jgi:hypothetical protein
MHGQFGEVHVRLWSHEDAESGLQPIRLGTCPLLINSGELTISDVEGSNTVSVVIKAGQYELVALGDDSRESGTLDLVFRPFA